VPQDVTDIHVCLLVTLSPSNKRRLKFLNASLTCLVALSIIEIRHKHKCVDQQHVPPKRREPSYDATRRHLPVGTNHHLQNLSCPLGVQFTQLCYPYVRPSVDGILIVCFLSGFSYSSTPSTSPGIYSL
jgi:hypothetical protein